MRWWTREAETEDLHRKIDDYIDRLV